MLFRITDIMENVSKQEIKYLLHCMYWFLDEMSWKKKYLENLQYNLDNWDGLAHLTRRYTCKLVIQRKYSKELVEMNYV